MKKNLVLSILILLVSLSGTGNCQPADSLVHNTSSYVDDYASIYSPQEKQALSAIIKSFFDTVQIALVTVRTLNGMDKQEYATRLFNRWGVGSKSDNGLLILIAPNERQAFAAPGRAIQGELTDMEAAAIQRVVMAPEFKNGHYFAGTQKLLQAYINLLSPAARVYNEQQAEVQKRHNEILLRITIFTVFILLVIIAIACFGIGYIVMEKEKKRVLKEKADEINEEYDNTKTDLQKFIDSIDKTAGDEGQNLYNEIKRILSLTCNNVSDKKDWLLKYRVPSKIDGFKQYMACKGTLNAGEKALNELDDKYMSSIRGNIKSLEEKLPALIFAAGDLSEVSDLNSQWNYLYCLRDKLAFYLIQKDYASIISTVGIIQNKRENTEQKITDLQQVVSDDRDKQEKAKYGMHDITIRLSSMQAYCDKEGVSQEAKDQTMENIERIRAKLSGYFDLSTVDKYDLYIAVTKEIEETCSAAKKEWDDIEAREQQRKKNEENGNNTQSMIAGGIIGGAGVSYQNEDDDDETSPGNGGGTGTGMISDDDDIGGSSFSGGTTDGGGGGSEW